MFLSIAAGNTVTMPIVHEHVDEVRPWIDFTLAIHAAALADQFVTALGRYLHPQFIGIDRTLSQVMPKFQSATLRFRSARFVRRVERASLLQRRV